MYFPKSQITPNLYTNGGEFIYFDSKLPYSGYYFKTSTGKYYTGRNQDDRPNLEIVLFNFDGINSNEIPPNIPLTISYNLVNDESLTVYEYNQLKENSISYSPYYSPSLPTQQDYQNAEFQRYFCKKTNEVIYIEINKDQFDKLVAKDPQILWQLYKPFTITWQLTGNKETVARVNKNSVELASFRNKLPALDQYLKFDFTKYYQ